MYRYLIATAKPMLLYKRQLAIAAAGLLMMSVSFGAGLGLMLPIFTFLLQEEQSLGELARQRLNGPLDPLGNWLAQHLPASPFWGFMLVMVALLLLTLIGGVGRIMHSHMVIYTVTRVVQRWRLRLYRGMIRMQMQDYWRHGTSDGISRTTGDVEHLRLGLQAILVNSAQAILKTAIALSVAFAINWKLTLIALATAPLTAAVVRKLGKSVRKSAKLRFVAQADMFGRINEVLGDLRVIKMSQSEGAESRRFFASDQRAFHQQVRQHRVRAVSSLAVDLIATLGVIGVASYSAWLIFRAGVSGSELMVILAALVAAAGCFKPLSNLHHDLTSADAAGQRILEMDRRFAPAADPPQPPMPKLPRHRESIRFENLTYTYPDAPQPALRNIDLDIRFGEMLAIVGGNGSGKSTLAAALARLITPDSGRILIDGHDLARHDVRSARSQMAMVTQKTKLFKGSIADNIAYGRSWAGRDKIIAAATAATADLFIDEMPDGYDTAIGEGGEGVSGGQAQRLCIARAILRDPRILILDEATSEVDTTSEALIAQAMKQIARGRTTLVIAHRLSTIAHADRVIVMDAGRIVGAGKHDQLIQNCPQYTAFASGQLAAAQ